ncbi:hypothetical protein GPECTOR_34g763 [Gonium pectorale]|uniref:Carbohydrate kinase PfkB domain-containing protein n=1 Tax=Gonium pectorale TaxID=33097 RepID=A0A150GCN3_GONPE|nr:hypothetical protein GPECTOR_34g763 [Gonium pectorale]|eukprot:KXZ47604.1 hypothetical protein GPECTOR_34g763 [Gonium pectorale]
MECVSFTLIVDDIVLPNGETVMEVLGGGAGVGPDLPQRCMIWRGRDDPCDALYGMLNPRYEAMPPAFQASANYHLCVHPLRPPHALLRQLRAAAHAQGGALSVETYTAAEEPARPEQVAALLADCDIFSPNESEAESIVGPGTPEELALRLLSLSPPGGADVVVVRCGPAGVLVARRPPALAEGRQPWGQEGALGSQVEAAALEAEAYQVPAVADTRVVDVTGCGNAFCGGFLAALYRGGRAAGKGTDPRPNNDVSGGDGGGSPAAGPPSWLGRSDLATAGAWGCVAASFMAEERGVPLTPIPQLQAKSVSFKADAAGVVICTPPTPEALSLLAAATPPSQLLSATGHGARERPASLSSLRRHDPFGCPNPGRQRVLDALAEARARHAHVGTTTLAENWPLPPEADEPFTRGEQERLAKLAEAEARRLANRSERLVSAPALLVTERDADILKVVYVPRPGVVAAAAPPAAGQSLERLPELASTSSVASLASWLTAVPAPLPERVEYEEHGGRWRLSEMAARAFGGGANRAALLQAAAAERLRLAGLIASPAYQS